ncbi:hypothetical protein CAPTEDRAFT_192202 [Capitella teleta]|uniref:Reverse transcriptase domain-containing protein n=1 Tax=Capitella teleta TaxID=283909 RepID=R7TMQ2_CAPTE|nr:hypothetical protein CAPTEDRAFT_192202 [Capitella teleta]|eukprot:ELT94924.1 hypothetical protein CAPTEDRAFT_192202 [Capitella teleta]
MPTDSEVTLEVEHLGLCLFLICSELSLDLIIGSDLLSQAGCSIHYQDHCMITWSQIRVSLQVDAFTSTYISPAFSANPVTTPPDYMDCYTIQFSETKLVIARSANQPRSLRPVLDFFRAAGLTIKQKKCFIGPESVELLGYTVSAQGLTAQQDKLAAICKMAAPSDPNYPFSVQLYFLRNSRHRAFQNEYFSTPIWQTLFLRGKTQAYFDKTSMHPTLIFASSTDFMSQSRCSNFLVVASKSGRCVLGDGAEFVVTQHNLLTNWTRIHQCSSINHQKATND